MMDPIKILSDLFKKKYGHVPVRTVCLPGAGSGRMYYRLSADDVSCIGVVGDSLRDCRAFIGLSKDFHDQGIAVPEVYYWEKGGLCYLQEDLGDCSLFDILKSNRESDLVVQALINLAKMQTVNPDVWAKDAEYGEFGMRQIMWDLNYFKYEYLRPSGIGFDEDQLQDDFERFAGNLMEISGKATGFMYRDFQSRNVMVKGGKCYMIDFQGGRKGPSIYDAVSFLWQAKAGFSKEFRAYMLNVYAREYSLLSGIDPSELLGGVDLFALFRTLQVLGAYGLRGLVERKSHFIESIPGALINLKELLLQGTVDAYPELKSVAIKLTDDPRFRREDNKDGRLTIEVYSFSYKKGYPENYTGNGGGFMFDCRGMHNPGRYEEYKHLNGLDLPVIEFLKDRGEADLFSARAFELVKPTVERYIKRGFTNLQIGFGCTGGRHRSVYCAEAVSRLLVESFPKAVIKVNHREQGILKVI